MPDSDFYVGYLPKPKIASRVKRSVLGLILLAALLAIVLVRAQSPFAASAFEFGAHTTFEGTLRPYPVPHLITGRDYLLVAPGKHGLRPLDATARRVRLTGSRIHRDQTQMIEVLPESVESVPGDPVAESILDLGVVTLSGEIVDSKCYLGVMNPGAGKVHRDCAVRCISGGVPPALITRDKLILLTAAPPLDFIAEPVKVSGRLQRVGQFLTLDLASIHRE